MVDGNYWNTRDIRVKPNKPSGVFDVKKKKPYEYDVIPRRYWENRFYLTFPFPDCSLYYRVRLSVLKNIVDFRK